MVASDYSDKWLNPLNKYSTLTLTLNSILKPLNFFTFTIFLTLLNLLNLTCNKLLNSSKNKLQQIRLVLSRREIPHLLKHQHHLHQLNSKLIKINAVKILTMQSWRNFNVPLVYVARRSILHVDFQIHLYRFANCISAMCVDIRLPKLDVSYVSKPFIWIAQIDAKYILRAMCTKLSPKLDELLDLRLTLQRIVKVWQSKLKKYALKWTISANKWLWWWPLKGLKKSIRK